MIDFEIAYKGHRITRNAAGVHHVWTNDRIVFFCYSALEATEYIDKGLADLDPWGRTSNSDQKA